MKQQSGAGRPVAIVNRTTIQIYLAQAMRDDLSAIAASEGKSISEVAREAFEALISKKAKRK